MKNLKFAINCAVIIFSISLMAQDAPKIQKAEPQNETVVTPIPKGEVPKIVIDKTEHDFGKIDKTNKVTAIIKFRNEGKGVLEIKDVKTSCGCTSAKPEKRSYEPGEDGEVTVTFNPSRFQGPITKTVTIMTNDPEKPSYQCKIMAEIIVDIMVKPQVLFVQNLKRSETRTEKITIYTERLDKLEISDLACDRDFLTYKMERVDDKTVDIMVTVKGADIPSDQKRVFANLSYKTNGKGEAEEKTRVHVMVQDPVEVQPPAIYLFGSKQGFAREIKIRLSSTVDTALEIKDVVFEMEPASAKEYVTSEIISDEKTGLSLQVKLGEKAEKGKFEGKIILKTNLAEQPEVIVPLKGSVI